MINKCTSIFFDLHFTLIFPIDSEVRLIQKSAQEVDLHFSTECISEALGTIWQNIDSSIHETLISPDLYKNFWISKNIEVIQKIDNSIPHDICVQLAKRINHIFSNDPSYFTVPSYVYKTLQKLTEKNIKLFIVTNALPGVRNIIKDKKLDQFFQEIIISTERGFSKPNPQIFSKTLTSMRISPEECLMVGDSYTSDIIAGHNAGMQTCLLTKKHKKFLQMPTLLVNKLSNIPDYIC